MIRTFKFAAVALAAASAFAAFGTANAADTFPTIERAAKGDITAWGAKVRTLVIATDEELMIARDTKEVVEK